MQRRAGRENDEVHDQIRSEHARHDICPTVPKFVRRGAAPLTQVVAAHRPFLFDFLGGLPEEQIRRNRCAEDRHQNAEVVAGPADLRHERGVQRRPPVDCRQKGRDHVGTKNEGQPFEDPRDASSLCLFGAHQISKRNTCFFQRLAG